ncbi:2004_t:CDS:10 [Funneliformis geosporum]|uniref:2004_t:CDS:1 n=1 Tax=Funneliformis geosporum TaxID=1117311 RepID=A0A9W4WVU9_9GLOM|nr:2004_t:CDS:10 [Funneliformis geosporum]
MSLRRSARIATLTDKNKQNESVEQPTVTPKRKVRSKKGVEDAIMTPARIPTEDISRSSKTVVYEGETDVIDVLVTPVETSINKGKSRESILPLIDVSINKGKSKEIFQHSDGSKSVLEPIDFSWLQKRKFGQSHDNDNDSYNNGTSLQLNNVNEEDDDSDDWEEVDLSEYQDQSDNVSESRPFPNKTIQLTFKMPKIQYKARGITKIERAIRQNIHKAHLLTLLAHGIIRNDWCNDEMTQAMAFSLIEYELQALFDKALVKIDVKHANLLTIALQDLSKWWKDYFIITKPGIRNREYHEFGEEGVEKFFENDEFSDCLPSIDEFRSSLRVGEGSRDTSAQLFVVALRSLGIPARLVCSLQAVSFRFAHKNKVAASRNRKEDNDSNNEISMNNNTNEEVQRTLGLGKYKLNANRKNSNGSKSKRDYVDNGYDDYNLLSNKDTRVGHSKKQRSISKKGRKQDGNLQKSDIPPIFWCEVYFAAYKKWICVDPVRALVNSPQAMEPASNVTDNIMAYVVAYEQDVTRRYATQWGARTRKLRVPVTKDGYDWWHETLVYFARPYESKQDNEEDAHLHKLEVSERMPTSIGAFNNHPLYALERHLKKFEIIYPRQPIIGRIRDEPIYPRRNVKQLHTAETWLREGRQVKIGEQPVKHVKSRIYTLSKRRAANMASLYDEEPPESGLYGEWQTEEYIPEPIMNGKIPKNSYGNVNMFKESMCPIGGVHIPINGIGKVAKKLGIAYGDAVVGFDFQARRCIPVVHGIVVAKESETMLLEAWHEHASIVEAKNNAKREKEVLARWRKFIIGVQIRMRLHNDYVKFDLSDMEEEESEFHHGESEGESELYHGDTDEEDNNNSIGVDNKGETNESIVDKVVINNNNDFSDYMDIESDIYEGKDDVNTEYDFMNEENEEVYREGGFINEDNDTYEVFLLE